MKLVVYIPTYNRAAEVTKQLKMLHLYSGADILKVVVHDNCSTQPEYYNIPKFCRDGNFIYKRNVDNIGANPNILAGFTYCDLGDYLWILSDDDLLKPDAVNNVFNLLHRYKGTDLLYLTHSNLQKEFFDTFNQPQLLAHLNDGLGLISQVIYRSGFVIPYIRSGYDNLLSCFPHLAILFESVKNREKIKVCRISKADFFLPGNQPPAESRGYLYLLSFYGFTLLAENLSEKLRRNFLWGWWNQFCFKAVCLARKAPIHSAACFSTLRRYVFLFSLQLFLVKIFSLPVYYLRNLIRGAAKSLFRRLFKAVR